MMVDLWMLNMLIFVLMTLTLMQGHSGSAKATNHRSVTISADLLNGGVCFRWSPSLCCMFQLIPLTVLYVSDDLLNGCLFQIIYYKFFDENDSLKVAINQGDSHYQQLLSFHGESSLCAKPHLNKTCKSLSVTPEWQKIALLATL